MQATVQLDLKQTLIPQMNQTIKMQDSSRSDAELAALSLQSQKGSLCNRERTNLYAATSGAKTESPS